MYIDIIIHNKFIRYIIYIDIIGHKISLSRKKQLIIIRLNYILILNKYRQKYLENKLTKVIMSK